MTPEPLTDRTITTAADVASLDFDKTGGLLPVVAQDATSGAVLMVAFANREALEKSLATGRMHFWSRSRGALWQKGETSGNILQLVSLHGDCDHDTMLALVEPTGPACHTGEATCFGEGATPRGESARDVSVAEPHPGVLARLDATLAERARTRPDGSYTVKLLDDRNLRLKKLGEETAELVAALATSDTERAAEEVADLLYHALVGLRAEGIGVDAVLEALEERAR
jgi:phosphoribosyl-ATP pyrophosphohydrolase/phosphoribosyl-AMP cyclohydrolase